MMHVFSYRLYFILFSGSSLCLQCSDISFSFLLSFDAPNSCVSAEDCDGYHCLLLWVGAFGLHGDWPREMDIYLLVQVLKVMAITLLKLRLYEPLHRQAIFLARILFPFLQLVAFILSLLTPLSLIYVIITSCTFFLLLWMVIILPPCSREITTPNPTAPISGYLRFPSRPFRGTQKLFFFSERLVILDAVMLRQSWVGFLTKLGYHQEGALWQLFNPSENAAYLCIDKIRPIRRKFMKHLKGFLKTCNTEILATYHKSSPYAERMASNFDMRLSSFNNFLCAAYTPVHGFIFFPFDSSKVYFPAYKANTNNQPTVIPSSSALTDN